MNIGFIGFGKMGEAIVRGILNNNQINYTIYAIDSNEERNKLIKELGLKTAKSYKELIYNCKIIFLVVKPQNYKDLLNKIKEYVTEDKIIVSIAAGISTSFISDNLEKAVPIIRVMPNTPLLIGLGATALCKNSKVKESEFNIVKSVFETSGVVEVIPEDQMNSIISVNGSSPAYIYLFAKAVIDYAQSQGIEKSVATNLICSTLKGSAEMIKTQNKTPDELIKDVSSPGGTTLKALETLNETNFYDSIKKAMESCTKRAQELEN